MAEPKKRGAGFQKRIRPEDAREVRVAVITTAGGMVACSCGGWTFTHYREKVREDAIDRHLAKKHDGVGIRV